MHLWHLLFVKETQVCYFFPLEQPLMFLLFPELLTGREAIGTCLITALFTLLLRVFLSSLYAA